MADFAFNPRLSTATSVDTGRGRTTHYYNVHNGSEKVGHLVVSAHSKNPARLNVENIEVNDGPNSMGPSGVKGVLRQLKELHPGAKYVSGKRVSGAREAAGDNSAPRVTQKI